MDNGSGEGRDKRKQLSENVELGFKLGMDKGSGESRDEGSGESRDKGSGESRENKFVTYVSDRPVTTL